MLLSLALALPALLHGQSRHELKIDLYGPLFSDEAQLAYEFKPNNKWGLELGLGYDWGGFSLDTILHVPGTPYNPQYAQFGRHFFNVLLSGKSYIAPKRGADRFFIGLYWWNQWEIYRDPAYDEYQERKYGLPVEWYTFRKSSLGIQTGYKWVIMEKLIVEPVFGIDADLLSFFREEDYGIDAILLLKAGYRFPKVSKAGD